MKDNQPNYGTYGDDPENSQIGQLTDYNKKMRADFIKKVYGILTVQLLITVLFCIISMTNKAVAKFQKHHKEVFWMCVIVNIIILLVLMCYSESAKKVPINYILLFIFTACQSYLVSYACTRASPKIVLMAATMTCAMTLALTLYACVADTDFTTSGGILFVCSIALLLGGLFAMLSQNKTLHIILACFGVLLFGIYLIYDTQLIVGGPNRKYQLGYDDYIIGSLMLYVDIISIFTNLLTILRSFE